MDFNRYYRSLLRGPRREGPRADEALRDYQNAIQHLVAAGIR
jgi:hypothetical protein